LVLMCMAQGMFFVGNDSAALQISQEMIDLGRELQDRDVEALGRIVLGHSHLVAGLRSCGSAANSTAPNVTPGVVAPLAVKEQPTLGPSVDLVLLNRSNLGETAAIPPIGQRVLGRWRSTPTVAQVASWL